MTHDPQHYRDLAQQVLGVYFRDASLSQKVEQEFSSVAGLSAGVCDCAIGDDHSCEEDTNDTIHIMDGGYTALVDGIVLDLAEPAEVSYDEDGELVITLKLINRSVALV